MRAMRIALAFALSMAAFLSHAAYKGTFNGTFETIVDPACYNPGTYNKFTVGEQYLDQNNGIIHGTHTMLARWQGNNFVSNGVGYDMGRWSGAHVSAAGQRGYQPEDALNATPAVAVDCYDIGMLINTRYNPHRFILGGGYNDMYGYSWAPFMGNRPRPFTKNGTPTHLILQGNVGVNAYWPQNEGGAVNQDRATGAVCFYAYLRDTSHSNLHPIVILACTHTDAPNGVVNVNINPNDPLVTGCDYQQGVWFGSGIISNDPSNNTRFVSTYYTAGNTVGMTPFISGGNPPMPFFRAHITPEDWVQLIQAIENPQSPQASCPAHGYSTNPADYELEYAGLIAESAIRNDVYDVSDSQWVRNDNNKPQVMLGVHGYGIGIYRGIPN